MCTRGQTFIMKNLCILAICLATLFACQSDQQSVDEDFTVHVRIASDPGAITPMFSSSSIMARQIYPALFLQLGEIDPQTLELSPILAKTIPEKEVIERGPFAGGIQYTFEILDEAVWQDGSPVDAEDYVFTLKTVKHPGVNSPSFRAAVQELVDVKVDEANPKKFTVIFSEDYILAKQIASSLEILPEHIYDPSLALRKVELIDFQDTTIINNLIKTNEPFLNFATQINDATLRRSIIEGAGPYTIDSWETDQYLSVKRKDNWWGNQFPERTYLQAKPNEIVFHFIPDETTAITQLKSGAIDIMDIRSGETFQSLKNENSGNLSFFTPQLTRYYYLLLNNDSEFLQYAPVRKAIARMIDIENFMDIIEYGEGTRTVGPIMPFSKAYNKQLGEIPYSLEEAKKILANDGWSDANDNGILDKTINGQLKDLQLNIHTSDGELGKRLSLLLKESGKDVGIDFNITQKAFKLIRRDNMSTGNFDIVPMIQITYLGDYDPYNSWHSDNTGSGKGNYARYRDQTVDDIIENIQEETDEEKRQELYLAFQKEIHEDQPVVFLYAPVSKIISNNRIKPLISVQKPGYFPNAFELSQN